MFRPNEQSPPMDFNTASKLIENLNQAIPDAISKVGGALKTMKITLQKSMTDSLPNHLSTALRDANSRYAAVVEGLEDGVGRRVLQNASGQPVNPEVAAEYLTNGNQFAQYSSNQLRSLIGDSNIPKIMRVIVQRTFEKSFDEESGVLDGKKLAQNWQRVNPNVRKLLPPDQEHSIDQYIKDIRTIGMKPPPDPLNPTSLPIVDFTRAGAILNLGTRAVLSLAHDRFASMLLDPQVVRDLQASVGKSTQSHGAAPITQRLMFQVLHQERRDNNDGNK